jgi:hypothetical protein
MKKRKFEIINGKKYYFACNCKIKTLDCCTAEMWDALYKPKPIMKMNTERAKTLINKVNLPEYFPHWRAVGYLEAIDKAEVLAECIDGLICGTCDGETAEEVLRKWERDK